jgi:arabinofuranosyltransferase
MIRAISKLKIEPVLLITSLLYTVWALVFIYRTSYVASDSKLYFLLFDDAMISMRYAWNFSQGNGLVWNPGEYVEGYTNLLMTLVMSSILFFLNKRYAVLAIQVLGILFVLGTAFFTLKTYNAITNSEKSNLKYILFSLVLTYYPLSFWSLMGMETGLLALLVSAGILCSIQYMKSMATKWLWGMAFCFGLAYLARNDAIIFAALSFLFVLSKLKINDKVFIRNYFIAAVIITAFPILQTLFRYTYYGEILPNTYTLKLVGMGLNDRVTNGWGFIKPFLDESIFILLASILGLFLRPSLKKMYLLSFFPISVAYQVYVGGDPWAYWRILTPVIPIFFVYFIYSFENIIGNGSKNTLNFIFVLTLAILSIYGMDKRFFEEMTFQTYPIAVERGFKHIETAIALDEITTPDATIGVFYAGALPYYLDRYAIDFLGKSDKYIANLEPDTSGAVAWNGMTSVPGHNKYDLEYSIQNLRPTYVEQFYWGNQEVVGWAEDNYSRVKYNDIGLYLLKDSPYVYWDKIKIYLDQFTYENHLQSLSRLRAPAQK